MSTLFIVVCPACGLLYDDSSPTKNCVVCKADLISKFQKRELFLPNCLACGNPIRGRRPNVQYCSNRCRAAFQRKKLAEPELYHAPTWERSDKKRLFAFRREVVALGYKMAPHDHLPQAMWYLAAEDEVNDPRITQLLPGYASDLKKLVAEYPAWRAKQLWAKATPLASLIAKYMDHPLWPLALP